MEMWEEAAKADILGVQVYAFGLYAALGMAAALIALGLLSKRAKLKQGTAPLTGTLAIVCGFIVSRLFFCLMDRNLGAPVPLNGVLLLTGGGYSMIGAIIGAAFGAVISAKLTRQSPQRLLDCLAPALLLFIACERLGEGLVEEFGISRPLVGDLLKGTILAVEGDYDWRLATYLLEAFTALILAVILLLDLKGGKRPGDTFVLFLILFGATQVIWESLRFDQHMHLSFVGLQQVMAMMLLAAGVAVAALRHMKDKKRLAVCALVSLPLAVALGVGLEFAIDRTQMNRYLLYALFALVLAVPAFLGIRLRREN